MQDAIKRRQLEQFPTLVFVIKLTKYATVFCDRLGTLLFLVDREIDTKHSKTEVIIRKMIGNGSDKIDRWREHWGDQVKIVETLWIAGAPDIC